MAIEYYGLMIEKDSETGLENYYLTKINNPFIVNNYYNSFERGLFFKDLYESIIVKRNIILSKLLDDYYNEFDTYKDILARLNKVDLEHLNTYLTPEIINLISEFIDIETAYIEDELFYHLLNKLFNSYNEIDMFIVSEDEFEIEEADNNLKRIRIRQEKFKNNLLFGAGHIIWIV